MEMMKTIAATTLGCKVNFYETEAMLAQFVQCGYRVVDFTETADIYLINTCTVTNLGDKKSRQMIRRAHGQNPEALIVAAGCYAQVAPEELAKIEGVGLIIGTKDRRLVVEHVETRLAGLLTDVSLVSDVMRERVFEPLAVEKLQDRQRAYIKIQEGCDRFCAYCIIPYARGPVRSRPLDDTLEEIRRLAANGYKEIVLAGIHVASYGKDLGDVNLLKMLRAAHEIDGICRIRMSSVEPTIMTEEFVREASEMPKLCNHFHLSLQSGCDRTLTQMNRRYTAAQYRDAVMLLRKWLPDVAITTDVIAGFPGETEADFAESFAFIESVQLTRLHVFPYSPKRGTPAAKFSEQVTKSVKEERVKRLMDVSASLHNRFLQGFIGREVDVLFEQRTNDGLYEGHAMNYMHIVTPSEYDITNQICKVLITGISGESAFGTLASPDSLE